MRIATVLCRADFLCMGQGACVSIVHKTTRGGVYARGCNSIHVPAAPPPSRISRAGLVSPYLCQMRRIDCPVLPRTDLIESTPPRTTWGVRVRAFIHYPESPSGALYGLWGTRPLGPVSRIGSELRRVPARGIYPWIPSILFHQGLRRHPSDVAWYPRSSQPVSVIVKE
jgi:hypothetical protein